MFINNLSSDTESAKWMTVRDQDQQRSPLPSKRISVEKVTSSNIFQILQDLSEEGEIVEKGENGENEEFVEEEPLQNHDTVGGKVNEEEDRLGRKKMVLDREEEERVVQCLRIQEVW